jgi:hypothetical protein
MGEATAVMTDTVDSLLTSFPKTQKLRGLASGGEVRRDTGAFSLTSILEFIGTKDRWKFSWSSDPGKAERSN